MSTGRQCKHRTTVFNNHIADWLMIRCQRTLGHTGLHAAVTPSDTCHVLTKWSY